MQQVSARAFADARPVDVYDMPLPIGGMTQRARLRFGRAWILHRHNIMRLAAAGIVVVIGAGLIEMRGVIATGAMDLVDLGRGELTRVGFSVSRINISGQTLTSEGTILKALAIPPGSSSIDYDVAAALERVAAIPSIKTVTIRKIYPGELQVAVTEKVPVARWRIGDKAYIVDESGQPVALDDGSFKTLPLVVGEGAADDAMVMVHALDRYPTLKQQIAALSRIGDRRWDLIFYSGLRVQLPENGVAQALQQLQDDQTNYQLLDRDVQVIDMRVAGMVSLKLGELAAKAHADELKKNKHVTKGDSDYETPAERAAEAKAQ